MMVNTIYTLGYSTQYITETAQGTVREHKVGGRRPTSQEAHSISKSWLQSALWGAKNTAQTEALTQPLSAHR